MISALDAFGKLPSGFAEGDMHWWGTLEECRKIEGAVHAIGGQKQVQFVGKSCFSPTLFVSILLKSIMFVYSNCSLTNSLACFK